MILIKTKQQTEDNAKVHNVKDFPLSSICYVWIAK